jgi:hypothetical protein
MSEPIPITDPAWRRAVDAALLRTGELVCLLMKDSLRDWFVVRDQAELDQVLARVGVISPIGKSDQIRLLATPEFPHRGLDEHALREAAKEIAARSWVLVACKREGNPELHDVLGSDEPAEVDEWFSGPHDGERFVGEDPFVRARKIYPDGDEGFFAFGVRPDGTVLVGSF